MEEKNSPVIEVYKVLKDYSDENNQMTKDEIYQKLSERGIEISDDTLTKCIKQINQQMDVEIHVTKGRYAKYQLKDRLFKFSELKLMVDAVNSSSVIDEKTTTDIVNSLKKAGSFYEAKELERSSTGINKAKTQNTLLLENIDIIQKSFQERCQIEFDYMEWAPDKKLRKKEIVSKTTGKVYNHSIEPWKLFWANDRYYLFGYDTYVKGDKPKIRNYRVDKMSNIRLLNVKRQFIGQFSQNNMDTYVAEHMGMYGDDVQTIEVEVPEYLIGAFIDQYGTGIKIEKAEVEEKYRIRFRSSVSPIVLGWMIGMGEVKLLKPDSAKTKMKEILEKNLKRLEDSNS